MENESRPVLVLDDDGDRHEVFRRFYGSQGIETIHVATVAAAIEVLKRHARAEIRLQGVSLDHDLGEYGPSEYDPEKKREYTGRDVVDWMVRSMKPDVPVRIHSWNIVAATAMEAALREAGWDVTCRPFCFDLASGGFNRKSRP